MLQSIVQNISFIDFYCLRCSLFTVKVVKGYDNLDMTD